MSKAASNLTFLVVHRPPVLYVANFKVAVNSIAAAMEPRAVERVLYSEGPCDLFHTHFCFTFVRNPWDRLVSLFHGQQQKDKLLRRGLRKYIKNLDDFEAFVSGICSIDDAEADGHFMSAACLLKRLPGELDFIGKFEQLKQEWQLLSQELCLASLPHLNKSEHRAYQQYYTPELRDLVARRYSEDIQRFGYQFERERS